MKIVKPFVVQSGNLVSTTVAENDAPAYSSSTTYTLGQKVMVASVHKVYQSLRGGSSTVMITYASPAVIGWTKHGLADGTAVTFSSTGTLPGGLSSSTTYYVVNASQDTFNVSATLGGTAINTTNTGSGTFTCYDTPNIGNDPTTSPTWWLDCGSTNAWRPFDSLVQTQLTADVSANFVVNVPQRIDTVALLNLTPGTTQVFVSAVYLADGSTVYNETVTLYTDETPVTDWYEYYFTDFRQRQDIILNDLPPYLNVNVSVTLQGSAGSTVGVGAVIYGKSKDISSAKAGVEQGAKVSITDYSVKTTDEFGNYTITPRSFAKRANWDVWIDNSDLDFVYNFLSSIRTTPILFVGSGKYASMSIYGFYKSWEVAVAYPDVSVCTMEIDGLT
jgi:hypothetical protein